MSRPQEPTVTWPSCGSAPAPAGAATSRASWAARQVLLFDAGEREHPTRPGETVHVWRLVLQERGPGAGGARRPG